jgi:uncharacterized protein (TIGR00251 family)
VTPKRDAGGRPSEIRLSIVVTPRAAANEIAAVEEGALRVRVTAAPTDGRANEAALRLLAGHLDVPLRAVRIVSGSSARRKVVAVAGVPQALIDRRFPGLLRERGR